MGEKFANCAPDTGIISRMKKSKTQHLGIDNPVKDGQVNWAEASQEK